MEAMTDADQEMVLAHVLACDACRADVEAYEPGIVARWIAEAAQPTESDDVEQP